MLGTLSVLNIAVHWCLEMSGISVLGYSLLFFWWTSTWFFIVLPEYVWSWSVFTNFSWIWYTPLIQDCFISKIFLHYIFDFFFFRGWRDCPYIAFTFPFRITNYGHVRSHSSVLYIYHIIQFFFFFFTFYTFSSLWLISWSCFSTSLTVISNHMYYNIIVSNVALISVMFLFSSLFLYSLFLFSPIFSFSYDFIF